jgi:hypothetical protein
MRYRADLPLMVLAFRDNHHAAVPIPAGNEIEVLGPAEDDRFVTIRSGTEEFLVFQSDLRSRATPSVPKPAVRASRSRSQQIAVSA